MNWLTVQGFHKEKALISLATMRTVQGLRLAEPLVNAVTVRVGTGTDLSG